MNSYLIPYPNTGSDVYKLGKFEIKKDFYVKASIYGSSLDKIVIENVYSSSTVEYAFKFIPDILLEVISSQKRQIDFNGYYISFLLGQLGKTEFKKISQKFITKKKKIPPEILIDKVHIVKTLVGDGITTRELSHYFQCEEEDIDNSLKLLDK